MCRRGGGLAFWSRWVGGLFGSTDPAVILQELERCLRQGDADGFAHAVSAHQGALVDCFPGWVAALPSSPPDRRMVLLAAATWVAEERGDSSLIEQLRPPVPTISRLLDRAEELADNGQFNDALPLFRRARDTASLAPDDKARATLALGRCLLHLARVAEAESSLRDALRQGVKLGDTELETETLELLYEGARWRADGTSAAMYADRRARLYRLAGDDDRCEAWTTRAAWSREGEPGVRAVVRTPTGRMYLPDQAPLPLPEGSSIVLHSKRPLLAAVRAALDDAEAQARAEQQQPAMQALARALKIDPASPEVHTTRGMVLLDFGFMDKARQAFERAEELAPSWHDISVHLALIDALTSGRADLTCWQFYRACAAGDLDVRQRIKMARKLARKTMLPSILLEFGLALEEADQREEADQVYHRAMEKESDPSTRTRLLLRRAMLDPGEGAQRMLEQADALKGHLLSAAEARILLRMLGVR